MTRLRTEPAQEAAGRLEQLLAAIKGSMGRVPNMYADMGKLSPLALEVALHLEAVLSRTTLSKQEVEAIKLAVSETALCNYCLAAHTAIGRKAGLDDEAILGLRHGLPSGDERLDALAHFARSLVSSRGTVPAGIIHAVREAGYSDRQIAEILLAICAITFTNLFNRVNDTALDFPHVD